MTTNPFHCQVIVSGCPHTSDAERITWTERSHINRWRNRSWDVKTWKRFPHYWPLSTGHRWFPSYMTKMLSFLGSFSVSLDKMLTKHQSCRWLETSWRSSDATLMARLVATRTDLSCPCGSKIRLDYYVTIPCHITLRRYSSTKRLV